MEYHFIAEIFPEERKGKQISRPEVEFSNTGYSDGAMISSFVVSLQQLSFTPFLR